MEINESVLIVEDNPDNIRFISEVLSSSNYQIQTAKSGKRALEILGVSTPALILLDILMPEMDGFETCRQIKELPDKEDIPIIFISALDDTDSIIKGFEHGGVDYITKPFNKREVLARINLHLQLHEQTCKIKDQYNHVVALEKERDNLVNMLIHDMRTPLSTLSLGIESMRLDGPNEPLDMELLDNLEICTDRLSNMVSSILDISRMEHGKQPLLKNVYNLRKVIDDVLKSVKTVAKEKSLQLELKGISPNVIFDRDIIGRVVTNLVSNSLKFTNPGGNITVSIEEENNSVKVTIQDTGCGIHEKYLNTIFDKFSQIRCKDDGKVRSSGLGLTFCKMAVELHDGTIGVKSEVGKGSTFWFTLPL